MTTDTRGGLHRAVAAGTPFAITPNDNTDLAHVTRAISVAGVGALVVDDADGNTVTIPSGALAAGAMHPVAVRRVRATGTTATGIVGYR